MILYTSHQFQCFEETVTLVISGNKREDVLYKSNIFFLSVNNIDLANNNCGAPVGIILQPFIDKGFPNPNFATDGRCRESCRVKGRKKRKTSVYKGS